jgi:septum site-determining protein MinC
MTVLQRSPFQLKGSLFTLTVMYLNTPDLEMIEKYLIKLLTESPNLFLHMPVVIDLESLSADAIDFVKLCKLLRQFSLIPVGIRAGSPEQQKAAIDAGLGVLNQKQTAKEPTKNIKDIAQPIDKKDVLTGGRPKIITSPVRSGQQIYAKGADLIVLSSVSAGSEIIADGNIHVYGTLRGRALAGALGDITSRILCTSLAPELISIAGRYLSQDKFEVPEGNGPFQVFLKDDQITCHSI